MDYGVEQVPDSERWAIVDLTTRHRYRLPTTYATRDMAESVADRFNAIREGEPLAVIEDLRTDSERLRTEKR